MAARNLSSRIDASTNKRMRRTRELRRTPTQFVNRAAPRSRVNSRVRTRAAANLATCANAPTARLQNDLPPLDDYRIYDAAIRAVRCTQVGLSGISPDVLRAKATPKTPPGEVRAATCEAAPASHGLSAPRGGRSPTLGGAGRAQRGHRKATSLAGAATIRFGGESPLVRCATS
jgi:hypothetical protein